MTLPASLRLSLSSLSHLAWEGHLTPSFLTAQCFDGNYRSPAGLRLMRRGIEMPEVPEYEPDYHRLRLSAWT